MSYNADKEVARHLSRHKKQENLHKQILRWCSFADAFRDPSVKHEYNCILMGLWETRYFVANGRIH